MDKLLSFKVFGLGYFIYFVLCAGVVLGLVFGLKNLEGNKRKIVNIILETVNSTIADADSGKLITNDYVKKTYQDKVDEAKALYDSMPEGDQNSFKSELAKIDPDAVEYLYTYFF